MILSVLWSREGNLDLKTNQLNIKYVNISDILHYRVLVKYDGWTCNQLNIKYANISDILHYRVPLKYDGWTWRLGLFHQDQDNILLRYDNFLKQIWIFLFVVGSLIFSIYIYIYIYIYIQSVPEGKVNIPGSYSIGHSKQKCLYEHVPYSERFPRYCYLIVQPQNCW